MATALENVSNARPSGHTLANQLLTHFQPTHVLCGLVEPEFIPDLQKSNQVLTCSIRIQPGLNPGLCANADMPLRTTFLSKSETHNYPVGIRLAKGRLENL